MCADVINQAIGQAYQKGAAIKILQGMDHIRNKFDELQARRWPLKLLQNARDLSVPDQPVLMDGLHTELRYHLRGLRSRETARTGMDDLRRTLSCSLLFFQRLGKVQLVTETEGRWIFRRGLSEGLPNGFLW